jgi:hypothetical protein
MTANGLTGYGAVYMVPPALADFSAGAATISFDMSTLRTASRDWVYFTLMPFEGHNKFSYNNNDQAIAPNNINVKMAGTNAFFACQRVNGTTPGMGGDCGQDVRVNGDSSTQYTDVQTANGVAPDAARRDSFRIELSATHLKVCITGNNTGQTYTYKGKSGFCWVDSDLPTPLDPSIWHGQAVFLMTHVTYNAEKSCSSVEDGDIVHNLLGDATCPPNTWHWDNVGISPATPFTILNPTQQYVTFNEPSGTNTVTFAQPAPANAFLSFIGGGDCTKQRVSVNGGASWITAKPQPATTQCQHPENGGEYFTPIPAGTTSVKFTGERMYGTWYAAGISIWVAGQGSFPTSSPQPAPAPVVTTFRSAWVDQSAYPTLAPGASASVTLHFRNTGSETWQAGVPGKQVNLGIAGDLTTYADLGMAVGWQSPNRPATAKEASVAPGQTGTFTFTVRAPSSPGVYQLPLRLVADGVAWLDDQGVYLTVTVDAGYHSAWVSQSAWPVLRAGQVSAPITVQFRNTGTATWQRSSSSQVNLGIVGDDTGWASNAVGWLSANRLAAQAEASVAPGATATFTFQVRAPTTPGSYDLPVRPVIDGLAWLEDQGVFVRITVTP